MKRRPDAQPVVGAQVRRLPHASVTIFHRFPGQNISKIGLQLRYYRVLSKALLGFSVPDKQPSMTAHYNPNSNSNPNSTHNPNSSPNQPSMTAHHNPNPNRHEDAVRPHLFGSIQKR